MKNFKTSQSGGFTIIELMAVLAIVSILATAALATYQGYAKRAKVVEGVAVLTGRKAAITAYYTVNKKMPAYLEQLGWESSKEKGKWSKELELQAPIVNFGIG
ncbi:MAG: prepilin-type N-terminal cleavage/methylation domain-containing protein [Halioglobus sp.]|jgi:prepilin-type N-terminal cleavage/methylation domain-containing protein